MQRSWPVKPQYAWRNWSGSDFGTNFDHSRLKRGPILPSPAPRKPEILDWYARPIGIWPERWVAVCTVYERKQDSVEALMCTRPGATVGWFTRAHVELVVGSEELKQILLAVFDILECPKHGRRAVREGGNLA